MKYLYPYNKFSRSAIDLATSMGIRKIRTENSGFRGGENKTVINWGSSSLPAQVVMNGTKIINHPNEVKKVSNKREFFTKVDDAGLSAWIPYFTTNFDTVRVWLDEGNSVVARKMLNASGGRGLEIIDPGDEIVIAPLYTRYIKKKDEYRIHIVRGEVIDSQRKGLRQELINEDDINWRVRNLANGFVFVRNDGRDIPPNVIRAAKNVFNCFHLDFGAVDVIHNVNSGSSYVLEINTAPGLVGTTLEKYTEALNQL